MNKAIGSLLAFRFGVPSGLMKWRPNLHPVLCSCLLPQSVKDVGLSDVTPVAQLTGVDFFEG